MQRYHIEFEGIPEYINMLEDAQRKYGRAGCTIMDKNLLVFASTVMLTSGDVVATLLLQIPHDKTGGKHNLIGLVRSNNAYIARYGKAFLEPKRVGAYNL